MSDWKKRKNCRTCRFASVTDKERSYTPNLATRCLYPTDQLSWPELPRSLTGADGIVAILDNIKSGRVKKSIMIRDVTEGEGCPMWEDWRASK